MPADRLSTLPKVVLVTGTDTDVGKTIAAAALAAALNGRGRDVAVYKPTQAGTEDGQGDVDVVRRLAGIDDVFEGIRLADPMAPVAAAARAGVALPSLGEHLAAIRRLAAARDHVLVEGAGGLLVALDEDGGTLADIGMALGGGCTAVVVCRSGLGTLNHTQLTLEALERRSIAVAGLVIGSWPRQPTAIDVGNRERFRDTETGLLGAIPAGVAALRPEAFRAAAEGWLHGGRDRTS